MSLDENTSIQDEAEGTESMPAQFHPTATQEPYISSYKEPERIDPKALNLRDEAVGLNRTAKVVKGGRRFSFAALIVVGDGNGHVGVGFGKANEVPEAYSKASEDGKKNLIKVPMKGRTIPHMVIGKFGAARVLLKPASEGTGLIAGPGVRTVLQLAGIQDILTKVIGTNTTINVVKATLQGLSSLHSAEKLARLRGRTVPELFGKEAPSEPVAEQPEYDTSAFTEGKEE